MKKVNNEQQPLTENRSESFVTDKNDGSKRYQIISGIKNFLFKGWKKDLKKLQIILVVIFYVAIVLGFIAFFFDNIFGWRLNIFADRIKYEKYSHIGPDFNFKYPNYFQIDDGEGKNYGDAYLTGLRLNSDSRTGCDIRLNKVGLNFQKSDQEITKALIDEISKSAKDFSFIKSERFKINGENAFSLEFSFTDPINSKVHLNQVITGNSDNFYMIICGTGKYQYKFFEKDFQSFLDSIRWRN